MKPVVVHTAEEAEGWADRLVQSAEHLRRTLGTLINSDLSALRILQRIKFVPLGCDPLDPARCLNVVEQLNQTMTYHASFAAAAWLLRAHPNRAPLVLNLGTLSGQDIASQDGELLAEVSAVVNPRNNKKLEKDVDRLRAVSAPLRYVFYLCPTSAGQPEQYEIDGITVRRLPAD